MNQTKRTQGVLIASACLLAGIVNIVIAAASPANVGIGICAIFIAGLVTGILLHDHAGRAQ